MTDNNRICGHCAHIDKDGKCRKNGEQRGYWEMRTCFEPAKPQFPASEAKIEEVLIENAKKPGIVFKTCKICGSTLPLDQFPKHPRTADGHSTICRECYKTKNADSLRKAAENSAAARKGIKRGPYKPRAIETKPAPVAETKPVPGIHLGNVDPFRFATDRQLCDELIARGYRGKLTHTIELSAPDEQ